MSRWRTDWREHGPKKPPPAHGIRMKKAGTTWWGQRWLEALEQVLGGDAGRLTRGRTYARAGRIHDLVIAGGKVTAKVTGSRAEPYDVVIQLAQLEEPAWQRAIEAMAGKAQFSAELLGGQMPRAIDEAFLPAGVSLFPRQRADLSTSCSCPDWGDPCKHVAATHYVLGEALDRDPFLLFELRGKAKSEVLATLRAARGGAEGVARAEAEIPSVKLGKLQPSDYDKPRAPLPALHFGFDEPVTHGAVLRQLGSMAAWPQGDGPAEALAPLIRVAAETARRLAMAEPAESSSPPPPAPAPSVRRRKRRAR